MLRPCRWIAALALCAIGGAAAASEPRAYPIAAGPELAGWLMLPAMRQQAPAVLILPDAGGPDAGTTLHAEALEAAGLAVLVLDAPMLAGEAGLAQLRALHAALLASGRVDAARIGLLGIGTGGQVALMALGRGTLPQPAAVAALYPGCADLLAAEPFADGHGAEARLGAAPPVLVVAAEADALDAPGACASLVAGPLGGHAALHAYPAGRGFDAAGLAPAGLAIGYVTPEGRVARTLPDARLALDAALRLSRFMAGALGGGP